MRNFKAEENIGHFIAISILFEIRELHLGKSKLSKEIYLYGEN